MLLNEHETDRHLESADFPSRVQQVPFGSIAQVVEPEALLRATFGLSGLRAQL